jgi:hypothetical protein
LRGTLFERSTRDTGAHVTNSTSAAAGWSITLGVSSTERTGCRDGRGG